MYANEKKNKNRKAIKTERQCLGTITTKSQIPSSKPKGKEANYQNEKRPRKTRTVNRMNSSYQTGGRVVTIIKKTAVTSIFYLFFIINYKTELNRKHNG